MLFGVKVLKGFGKEFWESFKLGPNIRCKFVCVKAARITPNKTN
jgi:hypothetical protein